MAGGGVNRTANEEGGGGDESSGGDVFLRSSRISQQVLDNGAGLMNSPVHAFTIHREGETDKRDSPTKKLVLVEPGRTLTLTRTC